MISAIIVIPCYNEAARLDVKSFESFAESNDNVQLLFVDDGSSDGTLRLLESLRAELPDRIIVHPLEKNVGKAEAVRNGLVAACTRNPAFVGFWDADLATPLEDIPTFVRLLEDRPDLEMVFGSRVNLLGRNVHRNLMRHYIGRVFATAAAFTLGLGIYDTQCGAKLFRVSDGFRERLEEPFIGGWIFDVEMIAREVRARRGTALPQARDIIYEHPLMVWRDIPGSKLRLRDWFLVAASLGRIYWKYLRSSSA